jgi:hypothetical protein
MNGKYFLNQYLGLKLTRLRNSNTIYYSIARPRYNEIERMPHTHTRGRNMEEMVSHVQHCLFVTLFLFCTTTLFVREPTLLYLLRNPVLVKKGNT